MNSAQLLKRAVLEYYRRKPLEEPIYFHKREVAVQSLEDRAYIRHLCFSSMAKLYEFVLTAKTPMHLYYSSAYYEDPCADRMESKGWAGSDLMFDIDSDKYPGCSETLSICASSNSVVRDKVERCSSGEEPIHFQVTSGECINRALRDVERLYYVLREELGFKEVEIYFTGNRGFHVKVYDSKVLGLSRDERREIASYVKLENVDLERLFSAKSPRQKYVWFSRREYGIRRRVLSAALRAGLPLEEIGDYIRIPRSELEALIEEAKISIDPAVTIDVTRLSRFKYSLNCKTGLVVRPIDLNKYREFKFEDFSPWDGSVVVKPLVDGKFPIFDREVNLKRGELKRLNSSLAIALAFKGVVEIVDFKDFGVRSVRSIP